MRKVIIRPTGSCMGCEKASTLALCEECVSKWKKNKAFNDETLSKLPFVMAGGRMNCPLCKATHLLFPDDSKSEERLFFKCRKSLYLGAVKHRLLIGTRVTITEEYKPKKSKLGKSRKLHG